MVSPPDLSDPVRARDHARAQAATRTEVMPTVPPRFAEDLPVGVDAASVVWDEVLGAGRSASKVLARGTRVRLTDLRGDALQYQHVTVTRGNDMAIPLTTHHEAHHLATDITPPPPSLQRPVSPAEGVDHSGDLRVRFAENVQHALCGQVTCHLLPHDVAQFLLWNVQPDAQRHWEIHQVEPVCDDEHSVDGDLDTDDIVVVGFGIGDAGTKPDVGGDDRGSRFHCDA